MTFRSSPVPVSGCSTDPPNPSIEKPGSPVPEGALALTFGLSTASPLHPPHTHLHTPLPAFMENLSTLEQITIGSIPPPLSGRIFTGPSAAPKQAVSLKLIALGLHMGRIRPTACTWSSHSLQLCHQPTAPAMCCSVRETYLGSNDPRAASVSTSSEQVGKEIAATDASPGMPNLWWAAGAAPSLLSCCLSAACGGPPDGHN